MDEAFRSIAHRLGGHLAQSRRLHGGVSSDVFALEIAREGAPTLHVVARGHRTSRSRADDPRLAAREHALLTALVEAGLEVPRPLLLEPAPDRVGGAWLVMELVPGTSAVPVDALPAALPQMARFLSALHALDPSQLTLPELPAREDPVAGALTYLPDAGWAPAVRTALEAARPFVPTNAPRLLHGDFWPGNVLWDGDRLRAVLDWEEAALGDPLCDLAQCRVELAWKYGPETTELFTAEYLARSSVDTHALPHWDLFVASAGLAHLGGWGLDAEREATMRAVGAAFLERAAHALLATA